MSPEAVSLEFFSVISAIVLLIAWRRGYFEKEQVNPPAPFAFIDVIFAFLFTFLASNFFVDRFIRWDLIGLEHVNFYVSLFAFLFLGGFTLTRGRGVLRHIWYPVSNSMYSSKESFLVGAVTVFVAYPVTEFFGSLYSLLASFVIKREEWSQTAVKVLEDGMDDPSQFYYLFVMVVILVPITEEWLFRGFIQGYFRGLVGVFWSVLLGSVVFACAHYTVEQGIGNIDLIVRLFVLSCFIGYVYERQGNLWASVATHMTFNLISFIRLAWPGE